MPSNVTRFEQLMYLSLGIGVVIYALDTQRVPMSDPAFPFVILILSTMILLTWLIARRRVSWARWVILTMILLGIPLQIAFLNDVLQNNPLAGILSIVQVLMQGMALYLIFTGDAATWFKR